MNHYTQSQGRRRDLRVLADLEVCGLLSQDQIHLLNFANVSTEMSHRCTQRLVEKKQIRRVNMRWAGEPDWFYPYDTKRPDQVQHRLGKAWIYTGLQVRTSATPTQELIYFKSEEMQFLPTVKPDIYAVIRHGGENGYLFGEFQVTESGNRWDKDYPTLFRTFAEDVPITLQVVTTGSYEPIKKILTKQMTEFKNVHIEYMMLSKLRELCWRVALRQKGLTNNAKSS